MKRPQLGICARGKIERVIDGDTIECMVLGIKAVVRLLDCWAPEVHGEGKTAGLRSAEFLRTIAPKGKSCVVWIPTKDADSLADVFTFGRVLGHVWLDGDEDPVSVMMVAEGFANRSKPE